MKIPLSTVTALATELHQAVSGRTILAVRTLIGGSGLCLSLDPSGRERFLCLATRPDLFIPFLWDRPVLENRPVPFVKTLEPHLVGQTIRSVKPWRHDRILHLELARTDEVQGPVRRELILELVPRRHNIVLVDTDRQTVLLALRRVDDRTSRVRQVLPGKVYQPPPPPPGLHPGIDTVEDFQMAILEDKSGSLRKALERLLPWACHLFHGELLRDHESILDQKVSQVSAEQVQGLWNDIGQWMLRWQGTSQEPTLILGPEGQPLWLLPFNPHSVPESDKRRFSTLSEGLSRLFQEQTSRSDEEQKRAALLNVLNRSLHRRRQALKQLQRDLQGAQRAEWYRQAGQILMANLHHLRKGLFQVRLADPFSSSPDPMDIPLEPGLTPVENAQRYFKRHRKARISLPIIQDRLHRIAQELKQLTALREEFDETDAPERLQKLREALGRMGIFTSVTSADPAGAERKEAALGRLFALPDGWALLVGRNNKENDELTHRIARPEDLWFHAQGVPGSHVVLRRGGRKDNPGKRIMEMAAGLAAHFSRARHAGTVPVIYTQKRYVRKPKGAKPGLAVVEREKTIFVAPLSPERLLEEMKK